MNLLPATSLLILLAGVFGSINYFWLRLPPSIRFLVVALAASIGAVREIAFSKALLEGMLGLLLFARALHVSL